jgi:hypothetical protein
MHDHGELPPDGYVVALHAVTRDGLLGEQLFAYRAVPTWEGICDLADKTRQAAGLPGVRVHWVRRSRGHHEAHGDFAMHPWSAKLPEPVAD